MNPDNHLTDEQRELLVSADYYDRLNAATAYFPSAKAINGPQMQGEAMDEGDEELEGEGEDLGEGEEDVEGEASDQGEGQITAGGEDGDEDEDDDDEIAAQGAQGDIYQGVPQD